MRRWAWFTLVGLVAVSLLVLPLSPGMAEGLRVRVCTATGGSCGYRPAPVKCTVLSRDSGIASGLTVLSSTRSADGSVEVDKLLDGSAVVRLERPDPERSGTGLGTLAAQRLDVEQRPGGSLAGADDELEAVYRFRRHDDADAWLDHYHRVDEPVVVAAAGPHGTGLHEGVRQVVQVLGFTDPDSVAAPDAVGLDVPAQATAAGAYLGVSGPALADADTAGQRPRLLLDASGRATTSGSLSLARNQDEIDGSLATRLGFVADPSYAVQTDAAGRPVRLVVSGEAGQTVDGDFLAADVLPLREQGESRGPGAQQAALDRDRGVRTFQSVVLDLRGESNRRAFDAVFLASGSLNAVRPAPLTRLPRTGLVVVDAGRAARAVQALVARIGSDGVVVRTTSRTTGGTTTLDAGYSEDFAVPASRLTKLPGCSQ
ncbi:hypothetical protein GCM10027446_08160 [Angustibacter peucedani]